MIKKILIVIICSLLSVSRVHAQNAPVTTLPVMTACPGSVIAVPITVNGFNNIGAVSLTMNYDAAILTFINATNSLGLMIDGTTIPGKIVTVGFFSSATTLANGTILFTLNFTYNGGSTAMTWNTEGISCEYDDYPNFQPLNDIPKSNYYINGQADPVLGVDFTAGNLFPSAGQTVMFTDLTTGGPTVWNWTITPSGYFFVNGTNAGSQNPQVQFTTIGSYNVSLTASKGSCSITGSKPNYINCVQKGLWTGNTSADWNTPSNWSNYIVPDNTTDVVIPASSVNWPVYNGNLTIGSQCNSLILQGASSRMTVNGNLVILSY